MTNLKTFLFGVLFVFIGTGSGLYYVPWDWSQVGSIPDYEYVSRAGAAVLILAGVVLLFVAWHRDREAGPGGVSYNSVLCHVLGSLTVLVSCIALAYAPSTELDPQLAEIMLFSVLTIGGGLVLMRLGILPVPGRVIA